MRIRVFSPSLTRNNRYDNIKINPSTGTIPRAIKNISDVEGLDIAYKPPSGQYVYGNTLYLSGSCDLRDWYDDVTKVPTLMLQHSQKYTDANNLLNSSAGGGITNIVSHSLGGAVAQKLKQNYPERDYNVTTYGSPNLSLFNHAHVSRYRNAGDPISILDRGAKTIGSSLNPFEAHSYKNSTYTSGDTGGWVIGVTSKDTPWDPATSAYTTPPIEQSDLKE